MYPFQMFICNWMYANKSKKAAYLLQNNFNCACTALKNTMWIVAERGSNVKSIVTFYRSFARRVRLFRFRNFQFPKHKRISGFKHFPKIMNGKALTINFEYAYYYWSSFLLYFLKKIRNHYPLHHFLRLVFILLMHLNRCNCHSKAEWMA